MWYFSGGWNPRQSLFFRDWSNFDELCDCAESHAATSRKLSILQILLYGTNCVICKSCTHWWRIFTELQKRMLLYVDNFEFSAVESDWLLCVCCNVHGKFCKRFFGWCQSSKLILPVYYYGKFGLSICSSYFVIDVSFFHPLAWVICSIHSVIEVLLRRISLSSVRILVLISCRCSPVTKLLSISWSIRLVAKFWRWQILWVFVILKTFLALTLCGFMLIIRVIDSLDRVSSCGRQR